MPHSWELSSIAVPPWDHVLFLLIRLRLAPGQPMAAGIRIVKFFVNDSFEERWAPLKSLHKLTLSLEFRHCQTSRQGGFPRTRIPETPPTRSSCGRPGVVNDSIDGRFRPERRPVDVEALPRVADIPRTWSVMSPPLKRVGIGYSELGVPVGFHEVGEPVAVAVLEEEVLARTGTRALGAPGRARPKRPSAKKAGVREVSWAAHHELL